jgi:hypothetical protein
MTEEHKHEAGEDRSRCWNCKMEAAEAGMSAFETFTLTWYNENCSRFMVNTGLVAEAYRDLGLKGAAKRIFLAAMNKIHEAFENMAKPQAGEL